MSSFLKILSDTACQVFCDNEYKGELDIKTIFRLELRKGIYLLEFKKDDIILLSQEYCMQNNDEEDLLKISLSTTIDAINREHSHNEIQKRNVIIVEEKGTYLILNRETNDRTPLPFLFEYTKRGMSFDVAGLVSVNVGGILYSEPFYGGENLIEGGKWGCINKEGKIQIQPLYDECIIFSNKNVTTAKINGITYFINKWGEIVFNNIYESVFGYKGNLCIVSKDDKYGIIDEFGHEIVSMKYEYIIDTYPKNYLLIEGKGDETFLIKEKGKWGIIDRKCNLLFPPCFSKMSLDNDLLFVVSSDNKYGIIDLRGNVILPVIYNYISKLEHFKSKNNQLVFLITLNGKQAVYNLSGKWIIDFLYDQIIYEALINIFIVSKDGNWGILDEIGNVLLPVQYNLIEKMNNFSHEQLFVITLNGKKGLYNITDKWIVDFLYDDINGGNGNDFIVKKNNKQGILNCKGEVLVEIAYDYIECIHPSYVVTKDNRKGVLMTLDDIEMLYDEILPLKYDDIIQGLNNDWIVTYQGYKGILNGKNEQIVGFIYDEILKDKTGCYKVTLAGKKGVMDELGGLLYDVVYDDIFINEDVIVTYVSNKVYIYNYDGDIIYDCECEMKGEQTQHLVYGESDCVILKKNNKWGCLNNIPYLIDEVQQLKEIISCEYDDLGYEDMSLYSDDKSKEMLIKYFVKRNDNYLHYYLFDIFDSVVRYPNETNILEEKKVCVINPYYMFLDTETTGLNSTSKAYARLVQLSWIISDINGNVIKEENHIIYPKDYIIPLSAAKLHGVTTEKAKNEGKPLVAVLDLFYTDMQLINYIVGHNVEYDIQILNNEFREFFNYDIFKGISRLCTMKKSVTFCKILGNSGYRYPKLSELYYKLFQEYLKNAHNSLEDVRATYKCFFKLKKMGIINN